MQYDTYKSALGSILLEADGERLSGLWFEGGKYCPNGDIKITAGNSKIFYDVKKWLDIYFSGRKPDFSIPLVMYGTEFQKNVWQILCTIPYGKTTTYNEIAQAIAKQRGIKRMSAQAVGNAVARNRISIIIPCHRVIGSDGSLTGYAGGIDKKEALLRLEK